MYVISSFYSFSMVSSQKGEEGQNVKKDLDGAINFP